MREVDEEIREIKKEIIESRGLIIKTNNLTNALGADIKAIAKRQAAHERRTWWNSVVAYALLGAACLFGFRLLLDVSIREMDGEEHRRYRNLVVPAFRASSVAAWESSVIRPVLDELLDAIAPAGRAELVADLTSRFPVRVIGDILGLPRDDQPRFVAWSEAINHAAVDEPAARRASGEMAAYFGPIIASRRAARRA